MDRQNWHSLINFSKVPGEMISGLGGHQIENIARKSLELEDRTLNSTKINEITRDTINEMDALDDIEKYENLSKDIVEEMDKAEKAVIPKSTAFSTTHHVKKLKQFLSQKNLWTDIETIPTDTLAQYLRYYYFSLKTKEGKCYSPNSLVGIRAAIQRYLCGPSVNRKIDIIHDTEFKRSNAMLKAMVGLWLQSGTRTDNSFQAIEPSDMKRLQEYFDRSSPIILQQEVWFNLTYYFGLRGRETLPQLVKHSILFSSDSDGKEYAYLHHNVLSKNVKISLDIKDNTDPKKYRMYANLENKEACPVSALRYYLSKFPESTESLFPMPLKRWKENGIWYCDRKNLGRPSLGEMMKTISASARLSKSYTNHCVRVTVVTTLKENGFSAEDICTITGHKNVMSVNKYFKDRNDSHKRKLSECLQLGFHSKVILTQKFNNSEHNITISEPEKSNFTINFNNCNDCVINVKQTE